MLDKHETLTGRNILIHVDAASGGFVAPFLGTHGTQWYETFIAVRVESMLNPEFRDFSNPRVASINASGHKFGLVTATVGWILWRNESSLPVSMIHSSDYLMGRTESPTLSYSQSAHGVVIQYYNLACLGRQGFERITYDAFRRAADFGLLLEKTELFDCIDGVHRTHEHLKGTDDGRERTVPGYNTCLPLVVFRIRATARRRFPGFTEAWLSARLMKKGFSVPCKFPVLYYILSCRELSKLLLLRL